MTNRQWISRGIAAVLATVLAVAVTVGAASLGEFRVRCESIPEKVLRLHVLANSDSEADQALKLKVRDKVLQTAEMLFRDTESKADAMETVETQKDALQSAAQQAVWENGFAYPVAVELSQTYFNTRTYGSVTLPAGYYDALQVKIGAAEGKNWWCVLFPALCLPAAQGPQIDDVLSGEELEVVREDGWDIRFQMVEWYEQIAGWFR